MRASRCTCGLLWPCPDAALLRIHDRYAPDNRNGAWNAQTSIYPQIGRAGLLTPGQASRANGGQ